MLLFPPRGVPPQVGRCAIHATLAAARSLYLLINDGVGKLTALFYNLIFNYVITVNTAQAQRVIWGLYDKRSQGWRSAGVEPRTGSSTDKHIPRSTARTNLTSSALPHSLIQQQHALIQSIHCKKTK